VIITDGPETNMNPGGDLLNAQEANREQRAENGESQTQTLGHHDHAAATGVGQRLLLAGHARIWQGEIAEGDRRQNGRTPVKACWILVVGWAIHASIFTELQALLKKSVSYGKLDHSNRENPWSTFKFLVLEGVRLD
jgi:hypothetical protein